MEKSAAIKTMDIFILPVIAPAEKKNVPLNLLLYSLYL